MTCFQILLQPVITIVQIENMPYWFFFSSRYYYRQVVLTEKEKAGVGYKLGLWFCIAL